MMVAKLVSAQRRKTFMVGDQTKQYRFTISRVAEPKSPFREGKSNKQKNAVRATSNVQRTEGGGEQVKQVRNLFVRS